jgi:Sulfotransferase family
MARLSLKDVAGRMRDRRRTPAPFIVGVGRSGTTLLRLMLDAHPELAIPPETHFAPKLLEKWRRRDATTPEQMLEVIVEQRQGPDFGFTEEELVERLRSLDELDGANALRAFYEAYAERQGKPRWGDKTPIYVEFMKRIGGQLPEARFVHLIRDGRDVALSRAVFGGEGPATPEKAAQRWKRRIRKARNQAEKVRHYVEIRYEDLVLEPEATLRRVCDFVELDYDPAMLDYHQGAEERLEELRHDLPAAEGQKAASGDDRLARHAMAKEPPTPERLERWKREMSAEDRAEYESVAGDLLAELGYEVGATAAQSGA